MRENIRVRIAALSLLLQLAPALMAGEAWQTKGFQHFYSLEYDEAIAEFEKEIEAHPKEPEGFNYLAQALLYREMYRAGALESELVTGANPFLRRAKMEPRADDLKRFDDAVARAMALAQERLKANGNDTKALYALGVAHGLRGNCGFLIRKTYMDALRDATQSRKLCQRVVELDAKQMDARMVLGAHDYIVGSLPGYIRLVGFLTGFAGDKESGIRTLKQVAEKGYHNKIDAAILLGVVYRRERRPLEAIPLLLDLVQRYPRNYLFRLEQVQFYSDAGDKAKAVAVLDEVERLKKANTAGYAKVAWEKLAFVRGNLLFWYRDYDAAVASLKTATAKAEELDLNTALMAWLRLGQSYDMKQQRALAKPAYQAAIEAAPKSDAAREARRYLGSAYVRKGP
jgi:tetratricopeptide (TPR) repeat protein